MVLLALTIGAESEFSLFEIAMCSAFCVQALDELPVLSNDRAPSKPPPKGGETFRTYLCAKLLVDDQFPQRTCKVDGRVRFNHQDATLRGNFRDSSYSRRDHRYAASHGLNVDIPKRLLPDRWATKDIRRTVFVPYVRPSAKSFESNVWWAVLAQRFDVGRSFISAAASMR